MNLIQVSETPLKPVSLDQKNLIIALLKQGLSDLRTLSTIIMGLNEQSSDHDIVSAFDAYHTFALLGINSDIITLWINQLRDPEQSIHE